MGGRLGGGSERRRTGVGAPARRRDRGGRADDRVRGFGAQAAYCASKFGLEAFTRCLALELRGLRVSVNTVTPGLHIKPTSLTRSEVTETDAAERSAWNDPTELAPAFRFLAGLRGTVSGFRFDAHKLTRSLVEKCSSFAY